MVIESDIAETNNQDVIGIRTISDRHQIFSILSAVQKARTPISIKFENRERYYTSLILRTELDEAYMIIDEIAPEDGHLLAMSKLPFSIRGSHGGVSLFFRPNVISGSGIQSDIAFYKIKFPEEMIYQQRRSAFRAPVARALQIKVAVRSKQRDEMLVGRLYDLSISGCRINFEGEIKPALIRGDRFEECSFFFNDFTLNVPVTLKHASYVRDWGETTCGFKFEGLDKASQKPIDRFVYFLQREARRLETK